MIRQHQKQPCPWHPSPPNRYHRKATYLQHVHMIKRCLSTTSREKAEVRSETGTTINTNQQDTTAVISTRTARQGTPQKRMIEKKTAHHNTHTHLAHGVGVSKVQSSVHVRVRKGHHELVLGRAVLVELGLGLENLVGLPTRLGRALHGGQSVPSCERLGLLCVCAFTYRTI